MLKTLLKHEWKDTWLLCTICNAVSLGLSVIGALIIFLSDFTKGKDFSEGQRALMIGGMGAYIMVYIFSVLAVAMVMRYYFFFRYYKNLFTDQGYLMHTLPVKSTDLINSKLIIAILWQYVTGIVMILSVFILIAALVVRIGDITPNDISEAFLPYGDLDVPGLVKDIPAFIAYLLVILLTPIMEILVMYAAVGIGQMTKKNRLLISILVLFGINVAKRSLLSLITMPMQVFVVSIENQTNLADDYLRIVPLIALAGVIGITVGLYFLNKHFVENKLNLE